MSSFCKDPREAEFTLIQLASNYPSNNQAGSWVSCDLVNDIIFHTEAGTSLIKLFLDVKTANLILDQI